VAEMAVLPFLLVRGFWEHFINENKESLQGEIKISWLLKIINVKI